MPDLKQPLSEEEKRRSDKIEELELETESFRLPYYVQAGDIAGQDDGNVRNRKRRELRQGFNQVSPLERYEGFEVNPAKLFTDVETLVKELFPSPNSAEEFDRKTGLKVKNSAEVMAKVELVCNPNFTNSNSRAAFLYALKDNLEQKKILMARQKNLAQRLEKEKNPAAVNSGDYAEQLHDERATPKTMFLPIEAIQRSLLYTGFRNSSEGIRADQEANSLRIDSLLESEIIEEPETRTGGKTILGGASMIYSDHLQTSVGRLLDLGEYLGRGMITSTVAEKSSHWKKFADHRDKALASRMYELHNRKASPFHKELVALKKEMDDVKENGANENASPLLLNQAQFTALIEELEGYDTDEMRVHKERLKKLNEDLEKAARDFLGDESSGLKGFLSKDDAAWKFRVFQMVLLCSPFAPFSLFGPVLSWIEPLVHSSGGFADFISSFASGKFAPFGISEFGEAADALGLNDAIKWLFEEGPGSPIAGIMDYLAESGMLQPILSATVPFITGPLGAIAAAGVVSAFRSVTELELMDEISKIRESGTKSVDNIFAAHDKDTKIAVEARIKEYVDKKLSLGEEGYMSGKLANYLAMNPHLLQYVTNDPAKLAELRQLLDGGQVRSEVPLAIEIFKDPELLNRILFINTTLENEKDPARRADLATLLAFDQELNAKDLAKAKRSLINEFYFEEARRIGLDHQLKGVILTEEEQTEKANDLKKKITALEVDRIVRNDALEVGMKIPKPEEKNEEEIVLPIAPLEPILPELEEINTIEPSTFPPLDKKRRYSTSSMDTSTDDPMNTDDDLDFKFPPISKKPKINNFPDELTREPKASDRRKPSKSEAKNSPDQNTRYIDENTREVSDKFKAKAETKSPHNSPSRPINSEKLADVGVREIDDGIKGPKITRKLGGRTPS